MLIYVLRVAARNNEGVICPIVVSVYKTSAKTCNAVLRQFFAGNREM
jgi:hypothetical protein